MKILRFKAPKTCHVTQNGALVQYNDSLEYLCRKQQRFSTKTFGPEPRVAGVIAHIRKELVEVEAKPEDVTEWADVVLLALDGAMRSGHAPEDVAQAVFDKLGVNESRDWPDWRGIAPDQAIEHIKE